MVGITAAGNHAFGRQMDRLPAMGGLLADTKGYLTPRQISRRNIVNDSPANLARFTKQFNKLMLGTSPSLRINCIGDSTTKGNGGSYYKNSWPARLANKFRALGFAVTDNKFGLNGTTASETAFEQRFSAFTGIWGQWGDLPGGNLFRCTSVGGKMTYAPGVSFDTIDIWWLKEQISFGGGGDMIITVDGGATNFTTPTSGGSVASQTISQTAPNAGAVAVQKTTVTVAAGVHTVEVANGATNNIEMYGFEAYNAAAPTVFIRNMGTPGYTTANYMNNNIPARMTDVAMNADLTLIDFGINDAGTAVALATYSANLATLKTSAKAQATSDVLFWTWPPTQDATIALATQRNYANAMVTAAGTDTVLADLFTRWSQLGAQEVLSLAAGPAWYADQYHPSAYGNLDIAQFLYDAMLPLGA